MSDGMIPISINESFKFKCSKKNSCYNECCKDLNQNLTPYDILRLKNNLKISSMDFIEKYTNRHMGDQSGLLILTLKTGNDLKCPFISEDGCRVYEDRPASCRIYPLARAIAKTRDTGKIAEYYAIINEDHCKGFERNHSQTVKEWIHNQDFFFYNEMNDQLMDIISLKNQIIPGPLDEPSKDIFYMGCYNIDQFKHEVINNNLLDEFNLSKETQDKIRTSETDMLKISLQWVKYKLFGIQIEE